MSLSVEEAKTCNAPTIRVYERVGYKIYGKLKWICVGLDTNPWLALEPVAHRSLIGQARQDGLRARQTSLPSLIKARWANR